MSYPCRYLPRFATSLYTHLIWTHFTTPYMMPDSRSIVSRWGVIPRGSVSVYTSHTLPSLPSLPIGDVRWVTRPPNLGIIRVEVKYGTILTIQHTSLLLAVILGIEFSSCLSSRVIHSFHLRRTPQGQRRWGMTQRDQLWAVILASRLILIYLRLVSALRLVLDGLITLQIICVSDPYRRLSITSLLSDANNRVSSFIFFTLSLAVKPWHPVQRRWWVWMTRG